MGVSWRGRAGEARTGGGDVAPPCSALEGPWRGITGGLQTGVLNIAPRS